MTFLRFILSHLKFQTIVVSLLLLPQLGHIALAKGIGAYFDDTFPKETPGQAQQWHFQNAFPNLTFIEPLWLIEIPKSTNLLLLTKQGQLYRFPNNPATTKAQVQLILDISTRVQWSEDQGAYSIAFHPQFGVTNSPYENSVYICYSHKPTSRNTPDQSMWRVSKFGWIKSTQTIDPNSEEVLIQQFDPHRWHNGGAMWFDKEGFLLIACGDGGGANNEFNKSQTISDGFFGGLLRIDVSNSLTLSDPIRRQPLNGPGKPSDFPDSFSQGYRIPKTNPWMISNVLSEFFAIGLRSPHGFHYDSVEDKSWVGDVGQFQEEELNVIQKRDNLEWPGREGTWTTPYGEISNTGNRRPPAYRYGRTEGSCIIGGPMYRGAKWPELKGKVIFGDNITGKISIFNPTTSIAETLFANFGGGLYSGLTNFATDSKGEIYMLKFNELNRDGGRIFKLAKGGYTPDPPLLLSQTGLFQNLENLTPASPLIPYNVGSPLWSDGADKKRWIVLPSYAPSFTSYNRITTAENGWVFPEGSLLIKHFEIPIDQKNPPTIKKLETRVMVICAGDKKYGVTYRWNEAGTDATLISSGEEEIFDIQDADGSTRSLRWKYPSRSDCMQCHTPGMGHGLGLRTHQLNINITHPSLNYQINQLTYFQNQQMLWNSLPSPQSLVASRPLDDPSAPMEQRIRSYLDSNCAHCHSPQGGVGYFDARLTTPLSLQGIINVMGSGHNSTNPNERYIKPGDSSLSLIHSRLSSTTPGIAMPPLGRETADPKATQLLKSYIESLDPTHFDNTQNGKVRYLRFTTLQLGTYQPSIPPSMQSHFSAISEISITTQDGAQIPNNDLQVVSVSHQLADHPAEYIFDGKEDTYWRGPDGVMASFVVDLGQPYDIATISFRKPTMGGYIWQIDVSQDNSIWKFSKQQHISGYSVNIYPNLSNPIRVEIAAPETTNNDQFDLTIVTDIPLATIPHSSALSVNGGRVISMFGAPNGYHFVARVQCTSSVTTVQIKENSLSPTTRGNYASEVWTIVSNHAKNYQTWAYDNMLDPSPSSDLDDKDGDGIPQIMEYALGLDPRKSDYEVLDPEVISQGLPLITRNQETGKLNMTVRLRRGGLPLKYTAEFTSDFLNFDRQVITIPSGESNGWHQETIMDAFSTGAEPKRFGRLRIERE